MVDTILLVAALRSVTLFGISLLFGTLFCESLIDCRCTARSLCHISQDAAFPDEGTWYHPGRHLPDHWPLTTSASLFSSRSSITRASSVKEKRNIINILLLLIQWRPCYKFKPASVTKTKTFKIKLLLISSFLTNISFQFNNSRSCHRLNCRLRRTNNDMLTCDWTGFQLNNTDRMCGPWGDGGRITAPGLLPN